MGENKSKMSPFGKAAEKATEKMALREHADYHYKKQDAKEIPKLVPGKKSGGTVVGMKKGGSVRGDGIANRGKTKGKMC